MGFKWQNLYVGWKTTLVTGARWPVSSNLSGGLGIQSVASRLFLVAPPSTTSFCTSDSLASRSMICQEILVLELLSLPLALALSLALTLSPSPPLSSNPPPLSPLALTPLSLLLALALAPPLSSPHPCPCPCPPPLSLLKQFEANLSLQSNDSCPFLLQQTIVLGDSP